MSLLSICQTMALNVGIAEPDQVIGAGSRDLEEAVTLSQMAADELARRVDFGALHTSTTCNGDGTNLEFDLGADFARITPGIGVTYGTRVVRPLTQAEWAGLPANVGVPRYFLLRGNKLRVWPYLDEGAFVTVDYQRLAWCSNGTTLWQADTDTALVDEGLLAKGLIVRWRRQKGMDYADHEAEYEADVGAIARFDDRSRL
jgi:hypothetical protein